VTPAAFEKAALALPGVTMTIQWGADRVYKVGGKMFAVRGDNGGVRPPVSFKVSDLSFELLIKKKGVIPAPYMARAKWVMLEHLRVLPDEEIRARLAEAHRLVAEKLPKKIRDALIPA
jgi:predicted DNA-binding protein (MmcQ/YjbR family)